MLDIQAVRQALATALAASVSGLQAAGNVPGQIAVPAAVVQPADPFLAWETLSDAPDVLRLSVLLLTSKADDPTGQATLDNFLSTSSIFGALVTYPSLSGACQYARFTEVGSYGTFTMAGADYYGCRIGVEVRG